MVITAAACVIMNPKPESLEEKVEKALAPVVTPVVGRYYRIKGSPLTWVLETAFIGRTPEYARLMSERGLAWREWSELEELDTP